MKNKICLGTAKVGIPSYGHSTKNRSNNNDLFVRATEIGIDCFDTSPRYGSAESILGGFVNKHKKKLFISTKIDNLNINNKHVIYNKMRESVLRSIENLNIESIDLCYLHQNELSVISNKYVLEGLSRLKNEGLIDKIGASIYSFDELDFTLESNNFDWVQVPVNILDTSFYNHIIESGSTIKIAARSIFLQGILFDTKQIEKCTPDAYQMISLLKRIKLLGHKHNLKLVDISIAYVHSLEFIDQVLVGTGSVKNLNKIKKSSEISLNEEIRHAINKISLVNKPWTNPRMWSKNA